MRTVELVSEWDSVPFSGGYEGLHSLSDQGFSGAVIAGPTRLFMVNGTAVGILDGGIEAFDGADGTARAAPHDALPLLVVMQDRADDPRAQYYTEDTPISEVDRTLEDGNFTGFVELSENVLSGDYYLVYHQGRSMSVAWVGNSQRLITDDEAFEGADGEVGIYQVMPADIDPVEIPEPPEPSGADDDTSNTEAGAAPAPDGATPAADDTDADGDADTDGPATDGTVASTTAGADPATDEPADAASERADTGTASESPAETSDRRTGGAGPPGSKAVGASQGTAVDRQRTDETDTDPVESGGARDTGSAEAETASPGATEASGEATTQTGTTEPTETAEQAVEADGTRSAETAGQAEERTTGSEPTAQPAAPSPAEADPDARTAAVAADSDATADIETLSIPSLDPERSSSTADPTRSSSTASRESTPPTSARSSPPSTETSSPQQSAPSRQGPEQSQQGPEQSQQGPEQSQQGPEQSQRGSSKPSPAAELQAELAERETEIEELRGEIRELSTENEELAAERDQLVAELEEARAEIQRLETELAEAGGSAPSGQTLSAMEAIEGTNLFVRYHSKGEATLAKAQDGSADRTSVEENIRLEHHTQFDAADAVVDGETFEEFLHDSIQYRFVDWLVRNLLYEIRDTGHESAMDELYDALPDIDRADLNGKVSVTYTEDGQEHRSQETFDVVVRDRMGSPLVVANINDTRQPATDGQMTNILRDAERVGNASDSLAAAFLVTSSFFEPAALETAKEATSSGLFSRDKRKSFVNLSRKGGYHLCLLEARNREFHLAVPEL